MNNSDNKNNNTNTQVMTVEEVGEYLRIHPYTVRRLARTGKLPGFKIGGQWRFDRSSINYHPIDTKDK